MFAMLLIFIVAAGNLALGFALAVLFGHGPSGALRWVPGKLRDRLGIAEER